MNIEYEFGRRREGRVAAGSIFAYNINSYIGSEPVTNRRSKSLGCSSILTVQNHSQQLIKRSWSFYVLIGSNVRTDMRISTHCSIGFYISTDRRR